MRRACSVILMILSVLIVFQKEIIIVHYKLNQEYIEQQYCVNKNKPSLHCHGICHLKKKLQETERPDATSFVNYKSVDMLPISVIGLEIKVTVKEVQSKTPEYKEIFYTDPFRELVDPPPISNLTLIKKRINGFS